MIKILEGVEAAAESAGSAFTCYDCLAFTQYTTFLLPYPLSIVQVRANH
jgi:hypothetical protein